MARLDPGRVLRSLVPSARDQRVYLLASLINTYGSGLVVTAATLFGLKVVHLTAAHTGLAMTIGGLVSLAIVMPVGRLADRFGPRDVYRVSLLVWTAAAAGYVFLAHSFVSFLLVTMVQSLAMSASAPASVALVRRVGGSGATTFRSQVNAMLNMGLALGIATAGAGLEVNTATAYRVLMLGNAASCLIAAVVLGWLPRYQPLPGAREESPFTALRDRPFVAYTVLSGAMYMQYLVLLLLLPAWVVFHTNAPRWSVSAFMIINTAMVVLFQVRIGNKVQTLRQGGTAYRRAGAIFLVSCSAMGLAAGLPAWAALLLLAAAVVVHTYGELWQSSAMFAMDFGLAPPHAQGQYQGLVGLGNRAGQALSPLVLVGLVLTVGRAGLIGLGVWFALLGTAGPAIARWGEHTRKPAPEIAAVAVPGTTAVPGTEAVPGTVVGQAAVAD
jgi:Major Facilitator Superfamily